MRILLADDHILFRKGVAGLLEAQPNITVVGMASSVCEVVARAKELKPDLVLMDFILPDGTGLEATKSILEAEPNAKIAFLTMHEDDERLSAAIRAGAKDYLLKSAPVHKLLAFIDGILQDEPGNTPRVPTVS